MVTMAQKKWPPRSGGQKSREVGLGPDWIDAHMALCCTAQRRVIIWLYGGNLEAVVGFEGFYEVSNLGRVKSLPRERCQHCGFRGKPGAFLKCGKNKKTGYKAVSMSKPGMGSHKVVVWPVHRLVARHFVSGETPEKRWVNHIDGVKQNNRADNLEWVSPRENIMDALRRGVALPPPRYNRWTKTTEPLDAARIARLQVSYQEDTSRHHR